MADDDKQLTYPEALQAHFDTFDYSVMHDVQRRLKKLLEEETPPPEEMLASETSPPRHGPRHEDSRGFSSSVGGGSPFRRLTSSRSGTVSRRTSQQDSVVPEMTFSPVLGATVDVSDEEAPEEPTGFEERSPTPQPPPVSKRRKTRKSGEVMGDASLVGPRVMRSQEKLRRGNEPEQTLRPTSPESIDLAPAPETVVQFGDLRLLDPDTQSVVLDLGSLREAQRESLEAWWKRESGPAGNGSLKDFKAWMWNGSV